MAVVITQRQGAVYARWEFNATDMYDQKMHDKAANKSIGVAVISLQWEVKCAIQELLYADVFVFYCEVCFSFPQSVMVDRPSVLFLMPRSFYTLGAVTSQ